ncbi:MAG: relaxase/mobilization nuclease domain-containing protein [Bacteroidia bacterium]
MIIKFFTRQSRSYRQAINYVKREQVNFRFIDKKNLPGDSVDGWVQAFQMNEDQRHKKSRRKDAVRLRHIVISWNGQDNVSNEAMRDMSRQFMNLYNKDSLYLIVAHNPDEVHPNPHCHIICSGTDIWGKALDLNNSEFTQLKQKTEQYQRDHWPQYTHSRVEHGKGTRSREREYWLRKRGQVLHKDTLSQTLERILRQSGSFTDFVKGIEQTGLALWQDQRNGKVVGITFNGRNHRFRTLGISREQLRQLERSPIRERSFGRGL